MVFCRNCEIYRLAPKRSHQVASGALRLLFYCSHDKLFHWEDRYGKCSYQPKVEHRKLEVL